MTRLRRIDPSEIGTTQASALRDEMLAQTRTIVDDVRDRGAAAIRAYAERFNERTPGDPLVIGRDEMKRAADALDPDDRAVLERVAGRIAAFAHAQRDAIKPVTLDTPGATCGHTVEPVHAAGCYAPAGRYPLPSSVLMTAVTARAAGCTRVVVASPGADPINLAAAHIAGADEFLAVGGAQAVAALAYGFDGFARVDVIAGPGNAYVTAAKHIVSAVVGIDMLAGPSELLVLCDDTADPALVAADLLAQAEHDTDAIPTLVTTSEYLIGAVEQAIESQLGLLPTRETAERSLKNGAAVLCADLDEAVRVTDTIAPEHLEIMTRDADAVAERVRNAGAVFIGALSAEVLGDYGLGPNHTLPTGGTARFQAGLSVTHFLRLRTWIRAHSSDALAPILEDTQRLAEMEGLAAHKRAAALRDNAS